MKGGGSMPADQVNMKCESDPEVSAHEAMLQQMVADAESDAGNDESFIDDGDEPPISDDVAALAKRYEPAVAVQHGRYLATCDAFPGIRAMGRDEASARERFTESVSRTIIALREAGIPVPDVGGTPTKRVTKSMKMTEDLAKRTTERAAVEKRTFSEIVRIALEEYLDRHGNS